MNKKERFILLYKYHRIRTGVFLPVILFIYLFLTGNASAQVYWRQYHIPTNTTTNISYSVTSTLTSDYKPGDKGSLPLNLSSDTSRGFYPLDLVNDPNAYPWRLTVKFGGVTGILIDPYHVLTAGHCVAQNQSFGNVKVYPGYALQDTPYGFAYPEYVYLLSSFQVSTATDIAIIKLDRPLGSLTGWCGYGYNNNNTFFTGNIFFNPSYPSSGLYNGELMYNSKSKVDYVTTDYLYSFRTGIPGMSGSAEFSFLNGTPVSYGILLSTGIKFNRINASKFDAVTKVLTNNTPQDFDLIPLLTRSYPEQFNPASGPDSVVFYVHNYSLSVCPGNTSYANVYLSQDSVINSGDLLLKTVTLSEAIISKGTARITAAGINSVNQNPGNYWIGVILTGDNNTTNNTTAYRDACKIKIETDSFATISGRIISTQSLSGISGVNIQGLPGNIKTDFFGDYTAYVPIGFSGTITPQKEGYAFNPAVIALSNVQTDVQQNFNTYKKSYTVNISIKSPYAQNNVPGVKAYGLTGEPLTNTGGIIQVTLYHGWSGEVSLVKDGWDVSPNKINYTQLTTGQTNNSSAGLLISGYVYDYGNAPLQNASINGFPASVSTNQYGYYGIVLDSGWSGSSSAMFSNKIFSPAQRNYNGLSVRSEYQDFHEFIPVYANLKIFLSGSYSQGTDTMNTLLAQRSLLPSSPPETLSSKTAPFILKNREQYTIQTNTSGIVDWVVIELLNKTTLAPVDTIAALLRNDGRIVSTNGYNLVNFDSRIPAGYYKMIIMHRNHIAVMSADSVQISQNPQLYDFSSNPGKVTGSQLRLLKPGLFGMFAGDSDFDGTINSADYNNFIIAGTNSVYGYVICDFDNDGYVTAYDFALLAPNRKALISTQIIRN